MREDPIPLLLESTKERNKIPLLLEGVAGGRGSDVYITAKLYIVGERGRSPQRVPEGRGSDVNVIQRCRTLLC